MILVRNLRLAPEQPLDALRGPAAKKLRIPEREIKELKLVKRSLDARKKSDIHYVCAVAAALHGDEQKAIAHAKSADVSEYAEPVYDIPHVAAPEKRPVIVGFGPAGMFAALVLARAGARPIVLERGMDAVSRKKAVDALRDGGGLQPESNVQFGEGAREPFLTESSTPARRIGEWAGCCASLPRTARRRASSTTRSLISARIF